MKLVYAVSKDSYHSKDHLGVKKKVEGQVKIFNENGIETSVFEYVWENGYPKIEVEEDTDLLYFRRIEPSFKFIHLLSTIKKEHPKLRIVMEIPTYPFDQEEVEKKSIKRKISIKFGEIFMRFYINRIILIGMEEKISKLYGITVLNATNGVDFSGIEMKKTLNTQKDEIHVICVSGCYFWHGYERFIKGMANYYQNAKRKETIYLHVVGDGQCLEQYETIAKENNLYNSKVLFYGNRQGKELDAIYDQCDIALDSLGAHRKGIYYASSLKTREYVAKGIPLVTGTKLDIDQENTKKYILMVAANEDAIDMNQIIDFYHSVYDEQEKEMLPNQIRAAFYKLADWKYAYQEVIKYMKEA